MAFGDSIGDVEFSPHKVFLHAHVLETLAAGGDVFPLTIELDLVDSCNHRCGWCVDPWHGHHRLSQEFVRCVLQELRELGVGAIVYKGGGEPTLYEAFADVLAETREMGFEAGVVTNGSRLTATARPLAKHASYVRVSIDGPTPDSHRAVHGSDDFGQIVTGVEELLAERLLQGRRHPVVGLSFAMDYAVIGLVDEAVRLGDRLGVDYILLRTPFFEEVGRAPTMTSREAAEVRGAFEAVRRSYRGPMRVMVDHWVSDRDAAELDTHPGSSPRRGAYCAHGVNGIEHVTGRCLASPLLAVVAATRDVYPCCNLRGLREWSIGQLDYDAGESFRKLWAGARRRETLARIHRFVCMPHCTHPMSRYNEIIEYLSSARYHGYFV